MGALSTTINEKQCLNYILSNPDSISELTRNFFLTGEGYDLYEACIELFRKNIPFTDENVLIEGNRRNSKIDKDLLNEIHETPVDDMSWTHHKAVLKEDYAKDRIEQVILKDALKEVSIKGRLNVEKMQELLDDLQTNLSISIGDDAVLRTLNDMFTAYEHTLARRIAGQEFFTTGCSFLDRILIVGFAPGEITTIFGSTGVGKTTYKLYLVNRLINRNIPCFDINLEMSETANMDRFMAMRLRTPLRDFMPRSPNEREESNILDMVRIERQKLQSSKMYISLDDPVLNCIKLEKLVEQVKKRLHTDYLIVFIDLATMMKEFSGEDPRGYERGMDGLNRMAKRLRIHFVLLVQANQKSLEAHRPATLNGLSIFRPSLANIKNSGGIAERSRTVLSVFREKYYATRFFPDDEDVANLDDIVEIQILKQSNGSVGRKLNYLHVEGQFLLLPIEDASELRTVANLRQDRTLAERREQEQRERETETELSERSYEVEPLTNADAPIEDVEAEAQAIINGEHTYRMR
jgi:replicative DNA helicase